LCAQQGLKTLIWDLDPQGSSSFYLGVQANIKNESKKILNNEFELRHAIQATPYDHLDVIPADLSARHADVQLHEMKQSRKKIASLLAPLQQQYDVVFLDSPPGISLLHETVFYAADWVLMPNIPTTLSIRSYETVMDYFKANDLDTSKIKCFFSMVDHRQTFIKTKCFLRITFLI
jgi:cellulose biosynthesis protein BcsQ